MNTLFKLARRNIWRNKRRTLLTMSSIFLAAFIALFTRSMQFGTYDLMIENTVRLSTGYIQIHDKGYWENKSINNTFEDSPQLEKELSSYKEITQVIPRLESFALASSGKHTKGTIVIATNPATEDSVSKLSEKIIFGSYLTNDDGIIVAEKLAKFLELTVGDTLVLLGQGYHGVTAAAQYPVKGIFHFPIPQLNNQLIYMNLSEGQNFYAAPNRLTSLSIMLKDESQLDDVLEKLKSELDPKKFEVMRWEEMNKELVQAIQSDNAGGVIMLGILYIIIGFGVFGTVMMMTIERRKEFAVMIAVGMRKSQLALMTAIESVLIGVISIIIGILAAYPILYYLYLHPIPLSGDIAEAMTVFGVEPILPFSIDPSLFLNQGITVFIIMIIAIIYPISIIFRLNILKAMRG
ncbi:MAG: ABC transporter permease [Chlorobi bacterium]|nr:ABC transporter permease [Chlorobiota bacterium]